MASKKPKVKQDISKIDFTNALPNLFNESPVVEDDRTFQNVTSDLSIKNIQENDISKYFKTIKEAVHKTISNFKGIDNIKFKLIITSEFSTPLAFDRIEAHFIPEFEITLSMNNFDDIYQNIKENFLEWLDEFQERGSGFVFEEITKTNIRISRTNFLRASSYFPHDLGRRTCILNIQNTDQKYFMVDCSKNISTTTIKSYN